jgi:WD40 repeat protein
VAPDGSWLAAASKNSEEVRIWDPVTGTARHTLTGHPGGVETLVVAPDGSWLAAACFSEVRIWDPITGTTRHTLTGHPSGVGRLVVAPDGSWLAATSWDDGEIQIWNPSTGRAVTSLRVAGRLFQLLITSTMIAVRGEYGLYLLTLFPGLPSGSQHVEQLTRRCQPEARSPNDG